MNRDDRPLITWCIYLSQINLYRLLVFGDVCVHFECRNINNFMKLIENNVSSALRTACVRTKIYFCVSRVTKQRGENDKNTWISTYRDRHDSEYIVMLLIRQTESIDLQDHHDDIHTLTAYFTASVYGLVVTPQSTAQCMMGTNKCYSGTYVISDIKLVKCRFYFWG